MTSPQSPQEPLHTENPTTTALEAGHSTTALGTKDQPLEKQTSLAGEAWRELRRNPFFIISGAVVLAMMFIAAFPMVISPERPIFGACQITNRNDPPVSGAPFGYDVFGCDLFDAVIWGARPSIMIGLVTTFGAAVVAVVLGSVAGFYGGWIDALLSRLTDIMFGFPFLVGAIVILTAFPSRNVWTVTLVLVVFGWAGMTRIMRSTVLSAKSMDYVQAARALGATNGRIIFRHILPNAVMPVLVLATISVGGIIGAEATLTFLGVGLQAPTNSWGLSLSQAREFFTQSPHLLIFPGMFLSITVLAFIVLGDAVRDAFDPKLR